MTEQEVFEIIIHAGNAKAEAYEALKAAQSGEFIKAAEAFERAEKELNLAHRVQTETIQQEAAGVKSEVTLLMVHAQDHLMSAITEKNLIVGMVELHKTIRQLAAKQGCAL
ncbi:MAG: phosphotransferase system lactose/cellobiose-specific subunit [Firmicutes bacterium]|nr:phosphotransferase system lactose/cellobiose-specific subunit [Bacillota bacterium]